MFEAFLRNVLDAPAGDSVIVTDPQAST